MRSIITFFLCLAFVGLTAQTQWKKLKDHPSIPIFEELAINADGDLMGISNLSFYKSTDGGASWEPCDEQRTHYNTNELDGSYYNQRFFAQTSCCGLAYTDDFGTSWTEIKFEISGISGFGESVKAIGVQPNTQKMLISTVRVSALPLLKLYLSTDNGTTFSELNDINISPTEIFYFTDSLIFFTNFSGGLYLSASTSSAPAFNAFANGQVEGMAMAGSNLYVAVNENGYGQVYQSANNGQNWSPAGQLPTGTMLNDLEIVAATDELLAATNTGIYRLEQGNSWVNITDQQAGDLESKLGTLHFAGKRMPGIWYGDAGTANFDEADVQTISTFLGSSYIDGNNNIYTTKGRFVHEMSLSTFEDSLYHLYSSIPDETYITSIGIDNMGSPWVGGIHHMSKKTGGAGFSIVADSNNLNPADNGTIRRVQPNYLELGNDGTIGVVQIYHAHIDYSADQGQTWDTLSTAAIDSVVANYSIEGFHAGTQHYDLRVFSASGPKIFESTAPFTNWTQLPNAVQNGAIVKTWMDNGNELYGATNLGIYHWNRISNIWDSLAFDMTGVSVFWLNLFFDHNNAMYVLVKPASLQSGLEGLYFSDDEGDSFSNMGLPVVGTETVMFDRLDFTSENMPFGFSAPWDYSSSSLEGVWYYSDSTIIIPTEPIDTNDSSLAVQSLVPEQELIIYPNPTSHAVTIDKFSGELSVLTIDGRLLGQFSIRNKAVIDLKRLADHQMLLLELHSTSGAVSVQRVMVE